MAKALTEAAASGNKRATLIALRDAIASTIDTCESGRDLAALSKRLMEVMEEIDNLPSEQEPNNPMARRRAKRNA